MTDEMSDDEFIEAMRMARKDAVHYFSSAVKTERELWVATEFLTNLGIPFVESELTSSASDPPDIIFRDAKFEIKEILDKGRRRHQEFKDSLKIAMAATTVDELFDSHSSHDVSYQEVYALVLHEATELARYKYPIDVRKTLDLLFYVNLEAVRGFIGQPISSSIHLLAQEWRSVSFIIGRASCVVSTQSSAPSFLLSNTGLTRTRLRE